MGGEVEGESPAPKKAAAEASDLEGELEGERPAPKKSAAEASGPMTGLPGLATFVVDAAARLALGLALGLELLQVGRGAFGLELWLAARVHAM